MYRFGQYLLKKSFNALWVIFLCSLIPLLGFFASIVLGLVTLKKSRKESSIALAVLCVTNLVYAVCLYATGDVGIAALSFVSGALVGGVFVWGTALLLRYYQRWTPILLLCFIITLIGLIWVHFYTPSLARWIQIIWLTSMQASGQVINIGNPFNSPALASQIVNYVAGGVIATFLYSLGVAQVALARWWQARLLPNIISFKAEILHIRIPFAYLITLIIFGILLWWLKMPLLYGMLPVAILTGLIPSLSLIHWFCNRQKAGWLYMMFLYIGLLLLGYYVLPVLLLAACIDSAIDFRRRFFTA